MAGYNNYSMSNNACDAYDSGKKPLSQWTKTDIINAIKNEIKEYEIDVNFDINILNKLSIKTLKSEFLTVSEWHHSSKYYNCVDFYSVTVDTTYTSEYLINSNEYIKNEIKLDKIKKQNNVKKAIATWNIWGGTRKYPKVIDTKTVEGTVIGEWFVFNGGKKNVNGNYINIKYI